MKLATLEVCYMGIYVILMVYIYIYIYILSGFSFRNIYDSQDSRERGGVSL